MHRNTELNKHLYNIQSSKHQDCPSQALCIGLVWFLALLGLCRCSKAYIYICRHILTMYFSPCVGLGLHVFAWLLYKLSCDIYRCPGSGVYPLGVFRWSLSVLRHASYMSLTVLGHWAASLTLGWGWSLGGVEAFGVRIDGVWKGWGHWIRLGIDGLLRFERL